MKIKVVDMPYEKALAQPREKHTPPRRPSMLFRALLRALSAPDLRATHFRCDRVGMERLGPDEPCLVLMNHSCFLDLKITAAVLYPRPFNIVCTSDGFVGKAGLMRALGCIPTRKFQPDTALVRDMLYAVKKLKSSILLYPEASYSFDGTATPLPESLGKCVKALGVPIVLLRTCGAFARDPLYNGLQNRRVNVSAELRYLLDAPVSICVMVNFRQICRVGEGRLRHDVNGFRLTGCGGKLDFTQKPETSYSLYADYFWYELGDMICIGDRDVLYYCFPQGKGDVVAKTRLAAEELYKLKRAERAAKNG